MRSRGPIQALILMGLSLAALPVNAEIATVFSRHVDQTALLFSPGEIRDGKLPARVHERDFGPLFANQATLACRPLASRPGALVVYVPATGDCIPLEALPRVARDDLARRIAPQDDASPGPVFLLLRPATPGAGLGCDCPPPTGDRPAIIIKSGFETPP